jgi:iron complex transport system substrate-binding protein
MIPESGSHGPCIRFMLVLAIMVVCCSIPATAITVTDDAGTVITLNTPPARIVSLAPSNTEILAALGLLDRVVGVTDVCNYPPEVKNITHIGGYSAISIEKVSASRPDLIVASDITPPETVSRLREIGLTVVVISPRNIEDTMRDIRLIGTVTGTGTTADLLTANLSARIAAAAPPASSSYRPTVAHVVWHSPLYVSGNETIQNDVIIAAGGTNIFSDKSGWNTVSLEEFLTRNPDIIIVSGGDGMDTSGKDVILEAFMTNPQYASLTAVKNHQVYSVNADAISRAGPRIADAVEQVAKIVHSVSEARSASQVRSMPSATKTPGFTASAALAMLVALAFLMRDGSR